MSTRISTNLDSLRGLLNLQKANALQSQALERLSTGTQLNSAADNPAGLIASNSLGLQISAINQSITNSNLASNVIGTADSALASVDSLLNQIRGLVQQGVNSGAQSGAQIQADQSQIDAALSAINRISSNTQFAGENLLDGSKSFNTQQTAGDAAKLSNFSINQALFGSASTITVDASVVTAATQGQLTYNGGNLTAATTLQVSGAKGSQVLFFGAGSSYTNVRDAINANTDATGVTASISTAAVASTYTLTSADPNATLSFTDARQNAGASDPAVSVNFVTAGNNTARSITVSGNAVTVNLATDANGNVATSETASAIAAAIAANSQASTLVTATAGGNGSGLVASSGGAQSLTGGVNAVLTLSSTDYGSDQSVGISVLKGSFQTYDSSNTATYRSVGTDIVARINGQTATGNGLTASVTTSLLDASVTFAAASNLANVDSKITITGGGSLFQIGEDVSTAGQIGVGIDSVNTAHLGGSAGKLYQLGSGAGKSLVDVGQNGVTGGNLVDIINQALSQVDTLRARLGAIQSDVIQTNVDSLGVALQNITDAKSQISDTDFAKTTAQLTQSQILSQAGISVLQIANQAPQQVLKLLG
jgi:flagellin